ncbi:hypothetical protein LEL_03752 [Akanthomyces lecanii RCEF 1005]|uniref:Fungal transcriptional regulatory protein n=1 Tax=Akanthomyces lecanii RCEF 1005 TaxID=1081108 RepID=A0A162KK24_CORDF|nr:hypothetical protein LEL_03752 [Akanthomyces lecanii RCEF 1005]
MKDGLGFARDFGAAITEQWGAKQSVLTFDHRQAHANVYCAAVSFNRSLFLIQNYNKTLDELAVKVDLKTSSLHDDSTNDGSTSSKADLSCSIIDDAFVSRDLSLLPNNPKLIAAKLFEFTEWVYKVRENPKTSLEQTIKVFQDCMRWYDSFFACTSNGSSETPLMMFAHTYYHFGVMCLLTPYVLDAVAVDSEGNFPVKVCKEAAAQIGTFIQIYSAVHNDGQLHDFMTFFKTAALAFLAICKAKIPE